MQNEDYMSTKDKLRYALADLCGPGKESRNAFFKMQVRQFIKLDGHPFGLKTWPPIDESMPHAIFLIADPGHPNGSVEAMEAVLRYLIGEYSVANDIPLRLRIIRIKEKAGRRSDGRAAHVVYFEVDCRYGTYICGECTDFSGASCRCEHIERLFMLMEMLHDCSIEQHTLEAESLDIDSRLQRLWDERQAEQAA